MIQKAKALTMMDDGKHILTNLCEVLSVLTTKNSQMFPDLYPYNVAPALSTTTGRMLPLHPLPPPTSIFFFFLKKGCFMGPWDLCQTQQSYSIPLGVCRCVQFFLKQFFIFWVRVGWKTSRQCDQGKEISLSNHMIDQIWHFVVLLLIFLC